MTDDIHPADPADRNRAILLFAKLKFERSQQVRQKLSMAIEECGSWIGYSPESEGDLVNLIDRIEEIFESS